MRLEFLLMDPTDWVYCIGSRNQTTPVYTHIFSPRDVLRVSDCVILISIICHAVHSYRAAFFLPSGPWLESNNRLMVFVRELPWQPLIVFWLVVRGWRLENHHRLIPVLDTTCGLRLGNERERFGRSGMVGIKLRPLVLCKLSYRIFLHSWRHFLDV